MYKMGCKLITCAILLSHVSSFAMRNNNEYDYDNFSGTITRMSSGSIKQNLDNINGMIQYQQQNAVNVHINNNNHNQQQNNNMNQQQNNNMQRQNNNQQQNNNMQRQHNNRQQNNNMQRQYNNRQQNNNMQRQHNNQQEEDTYGVNVLNECLNKLGAKANIVQTNTNKLQEYINIQKCELNSSEFLKRKRENGDLFYECSIVISDISAIILQADTQICKNNKIIESNKDKIKNISDKKDKIVININNLNQDIDNLRESYSSSFNNIQLGKSIESTWHAQQWYNILDYKNFYYRNEELIKKRNESLQKIRELLQHHKDNIKNMQQQVKQLENEKQKLQKQINTISEQNNEIIGIHDEYKRIYNTNYLKLFEQYNTLFKSLISIKNKYSWKCIFD